MGIGISDNYENIESIFNIGFWKVHKATRKLTGEDVSLWLIDEERLKSKIKNRSEKDKYMKMCVDSIQQMRRLCHPHILKIIEFNESASPLSFSAEPIRYSLIYEDKVSPDELVYIAQQLSDTLNFLHVTAKLAHLSISPSSILLTESFDVKICEFQFCSMMINDSGTIGPRYGVWENSAFLPDINFSSPEVFTNKQITTMADVFSFGCLIATVALRRQLFTSCSVHEMLNNVSNATNMIPGSIEEGLRNLIIKCLSSNPTERPTFEIAMRSPAFLTLPAKVLKYIDLILTKDPVDKYNFYKGLSSSFSLFSNRLLRYKFAPLFIQEINTDHRYAPVLLPFVVNICSYLEKPDFEKEVLKPLGNIFTITKPPEIILSVFSVINVLMEKVEPERHYDIIYPVFLSSLQSDYPKLHEEAIRNMPLVIRSMPQTAIQQSLIPKLLEFMCASEEVNTISNVITCLSQVQMKTDQDTFVEMVSPKILHVWKKKNSPEMAGSISVLFEKIHSNNEFSLKYVVPLLSDVLTVSAVDPYVQLKICNELSTIIERVKRERKLNNAKPPIETPKITPQPEVTESKEEPESEFNWGDDQPKKPRPLILPKKVKNVAPVEESIELEKDEDDNIGDDPSQKKTSMFSGMSVSSTSQKRGGWKARGRGK